MGKNLRRILLADPEEDFALALHARLRSKGYEVLAAADGPGALRLAEKEKLDLVIFSVRISKGFDLNLLADLKTSTRTRHIPVLVLASVPEDAEMAARAGAVSYLMKPYEAGPFLNTVNEILG